MLDLISFRRYAGTSFRRSIMKRERGPVLFTAALVISIVLLGAAVAEKPPASLSGPAVKILKTVGGVYHFEPRIIHPYRYVLSTSTVNPYPPPIVYDIYAQKLIPMPSLRALPGLALPPKVPRTSNRRMEIRKLKLAGKYWEWDDAELVYYNPEKGVAGAVLVKEETKKTIAGNPPCPQCNGITEFVEKYRRYYCYRCRKYVEEKDYLKDIKTTLYVNLDLKTGRVTWTAPLGHDWFTSIGVDPTGKYFYFSETINFYKREKTPKQLVFYRLNLETKSVDWRYSIPLHVRHKDHAASTYSITPFPSPDFSRMVFFEYDHEEYYDEGGKRVWRGYLSNPPAQAYVVDISAREHFSVSIPVTSYGYLIDRDNRYLIFGSNQKGTIHRIDLSKRKEDLTVRSKKSILQLILSASSRYLYVFNKYSVEVRTWPSLKLVKKIPLSKIFPGIQKMLTAEQMYATQDGKFAVIGVLKKKGTQWASSDRGAGFHLLLIGD